jgi:hypothetical protein
MYIINTDTHFSCTLIKIHHSRLNIGSAFIECAFIGHHKKRINSVAHSASVEAKVGETPESVSRDKCENG